MKNLIYLSFAFLASTISCFAQTGINYVETSLPSQAWKNGWEVNKQVGTNTLATREYLDGLGRPKQTVTIKGSPLKKDFVLPYEYDPAGREPKIFLSYAGTTDDGSYKSGYATEQAAFYNNTASNNADKVVNDAYPFLKKEFDNSPMDRETKSYPSGVAWQTGSVDRSVKTTRRANNPNEVRNWVFDAATLGAASTSYYAAGTLFVTETLDEDGNKTLEFVDNQGRTVEKNQQVTAVDYLATRYVYDDFGNLRYVIPSAYGLNNASYASVYTSQFLFFYAYDAKQRMTEKRVPGGGKTFYVYDKYDRLLLAQDSNQRVSNKWSYYKYDAFGRTVMTGMYTHTSALSQAAMKVLANGSTSSQNEARQTSTVHGYSNQAWPTANCEVLTVHYFDDYDYDGNGARDFNYSVQGRALPTKPR